MASLTHAGGRALRVLFAGSAVLAFVIAVVATPIVGRVAARLRLLDHPGGRRRHARPIPRIGGLGIAVAFGAAILTFWVVDRRDLLTGKKVKVLFYNSQVTTPLTSDIKALAEKSGVPVVGVAETIPPEFKTYQEGMLAQLDALDKALSKQPERMAQPAVSFEGVTLGYGPRRGCSGTSLPRAPLPVPAT